MLPTGWPRPSRTAPAAARRSCSATAMAALWRCKWRFAIPASQAGSFSPIAGRHSRNRGGKPSATWRRRPKPGGLSAITDVAMRRLFAPEFQAQHPDLMRDRREAFLRSDPAVIEAACAALAELDLRPELRKVKIPVLVLVGEHDEATPPPMSRELAAGLPDARLRIIPGCAHVPQLQSPGIFLEAIGDFLPASLAAG